MKTCELFKKKTTLSFEVFPPKSSTPVESIYSTISQLQPLNPDFISVTYGAGGSTNNATIDICSAIKNHHKIESVAHLPCLYQTKERVLEQLEEMKSANIENILALRGDRNPDFEPAGDFHYASDLVSFIKEHSDMNVIGACYPECHPECDSIVDDIKHLKDKVDAGCSQLITQLFFDNMHFYRFLNLARRAGITLPVSAGVMPIVKRSQIERTVSLSSASLPSEFTRMISRYQDDPASLYDAGIDYAVKQLRDLIEGGADGIHLYAMNDAAVAAKVYDGIRDLL